MFCSLVKEMIMSKKSLTKKPEAENLNLSSVADENVVDVVSIEKKDNTEKFVVQTVEKKGDKEVALSKDIAPHSKEEKYEERQFVREILENAIKNANKQKNFHLASELHKVNAILSDFSHVFNHLSGEARLTISLAFKKGRVIEV
jgi:hypothetical protein